MFSQHGQLHTVDGEYRLKFSLDDLSNNNGWELTLDFEIDLDTDGLDMSRMLIEPRQAQVAEPCFIHSDENRKFQDTIEIVAKDKETELGIIVTPWVLPENEKSDSIESTHVKLLSVEKLLICSDIVSGGLSKDSWETLNQLYETDDGDTLFEFTTESRRVLNFKTFVDIVSEFSSVNYNYGAQFGSNRASFAKNMIIGDRGGRYHKVNSYDDLRKKLEYFGEQESLEPIDEEYALTLALRDLVQAGRIEELYSLLDEMEIVEKYPHLLYESQLEFYIAQSKINRRNLPMSAVSELTTDSDIDDYDDAVEDAKMGADTIEETTLLWRNLIGPSIEYSHDTLQFVLGRYLHWKIRTYTQNDNNLELAPILYQGAAELSKSAGDLKYAQLSKYNHHLRQGFMHLSNGYLRGAKEEFENALLVAGNESGDWYEERPNLMVTPLQYKTIAEVSGGPIEYEPSADESLSIDIQEVKSEKLEKKLSLIGERIRLLQSVFAEMDVSVEHAVNNLRAKQFRLLANQRIRTQQYELAIEVVAELISLYAKLGDNDKKRSAIGFRQHLSAVLAETQANFDKASNYYIKVSQNQEYLTTAEQQHFHKIRAKTCRAKYHLLDGDIENASGILDEIEESVSELKYEAADLTLLIDILLDFEQSERSSIDSTLSQLSEDSDDTESNLSVSFDYKPAVTAVLSAQRLKTRGVDDELLRRFIKIGIAESFTPESSEDVVTDTGLSDISIDTIWRNYLPLYTHKSLEIIKIKENSVATGDYSDIASKLFSTFEKYLEVLVEFYGKESGPDWKKTIAEDPDKELTLGDLAQFFLVDELSDSSLECREEVKKQFDQPVFSDMPLVKVRNELDHGHIDVLSAEEYHRIKSTLNHILEETSSEAPIIVHPKTRSSFGSATIYSCELFWSHPRKQVSIETNAELSTDDIYFISPVCRPDIVSEDIIEIYDEDIISADERRVVEAVKDN